MRRNIYFGYLIILILFILTSCRGRDLTDYHLVGEKLEETYEDVVYSFEYIACTSNSVTINIKRENDFYCENVSDGSTRLVDRIYMYGSAPATNGNFDYVMVNNIKLETDSFKTFLIRYSYYEIGRNNVAYVQIHTSDENFKGYVHTRIDTG